jgi:hypothetical protein
MRASAVSRSAPVWRRPLWAIIAVLLLVPVVGMQVSREFAWTASDFAAAAVLLVGAGVVFEIMMRSAKAAKYRVPVAAGLLFAVALAWAHGAVGVF